MKKWKFVGIGILVLAVLSLSLTGPAWSQGRGQGGYGQPGEVFQGSTRFSRFYPSF